MVFMVTSVKMKEKECLRKDTTMQTQFKKNEYYTGTVEDLTSEGAGVVKIEGFPFFVEGTIPGETIRFKAIKVNKNFGFGRLEAIEVTSPDRIEERDMKGRQIGTMTLQHMTYQSQLAYKQKQVQDAFERLGHFKDVSVNAVMGMDHPWEYRNKAQIPVQVVNGQVETGFYRKKSHQLIPIEDFFIQDPAIDRAIVVVRDLIRHYGLSVYDEKTHKGLIRHIIVKRGHHTGQMMIVIVASKNKLGIEDNLVEDIRQALPEVVSIVLNVNTDKGNKILGQHNRVLWGTAYYEDCMLEKTLRISANSFYQVNTPQAERLYQVAIEAAQLTGSETVLDAYCGIGSISLSLAPHAQHVYAMEIVAEAIDMAKQNAQINHIDNVTFEVGAAEEVLPQWNQQGIHFDVAVVDPPRKGLDPEFIQALIDQDPDRIVYVSCNPATCARDCRIIADAGYHIEMIQPVDLFPQTTHVESVVLLTKSEAL